MIKKVTAHIQRFKALQGSPTYLARGAALGVFIGFAPIMPLKTMTIITISCIFPSSAVAAILVCTAICNPFTYVFLYYLAWIVGNYFLPGRSSWVLLEATITKMQQSSIIEAFVIAGQFGIDTSVVLLAGGNVLALPLAFLSYPLALLFFDRIAGRKSSI
jgi:uncharacterized protein (DUF2062 family)